MAGPIVFDPTPHLARLSSGIRTLGSELEESIKERKMREKLQKLEETKDEYAQQSAIRLIQSGIPKDSPIIKNVTRQIKAIDSADEFMEKSASYELQWSEYSNNPDLRLPSFGITTDTYLRANQSDNKVKEKYQKKSEIERLKKAQATAQRLVTSTLKSSDTSIELPTPTTPIGPERPQYEVAGPEMTLFGVPSEPEARTQEELLRTREFAEAVAGMDPKRVQEIAKASGAPSRKDIRAESREKRLQESEERKRQESEAKIAQADARIQVATDKMIQAAKSKDMTTISRLLDDIDIDELLTSESKLERDLKYWSDLLDKLKIKEDLTAEEEFDLSHGKRTIKRIKPVLMRTKEKIEDYNIQRDRLNELLRLRGKGRTTVETPATEEPITETPVTPATGKKEVTAEEAKVIMQNAPAEIKGDMNATIKWFEERYILK